MSGALIELVSKGPQDVYLTGSPQVSFFRQNYKAHTNFSSRIEKLDYTGTFNGGQQISIPIINKGDLLSYIWIESPGIAGLDNTGTNDQGFIHSGKSTDATEFTLLIGGQEVVKMDSLYIQAVHNLLYNPTSARANMAVTSQNVPTNAQTPASGTTTDHYLLPFFFSEDYTKVLPLIALQYHQVELRINVRNGMVRTDTPKIYAQYMYLDTLERDYFAKSPHEILIQQTQRLLAKTTDSEFDLSYFNHPVKAIHLVSSSANSADWHDELDFEEATLYLNGSPIFESVSNTYTHTVVPMMHSSILPPSDALLNSPVFTFPFCLTLNKYQPTGTVNFSRLDNTSLKLKNPTVGSNNILRVYAVNYNILRIKNGLGGIAFSN